jgi:hypothetical protein
MTLTTEATTKPPTIVALPLSGELARLEAVDVTLIGDVLESIDIGPNGDTYYRVTARNLLHEIAMARCLLDLAEEAVLDARQERLDAERHVCPGCPTLLEPDEDTCGAARCNAEWAMDCAGLR